MINEAITWHVKANFRFRSKTINQGSDGALVTTLTIGNVECIINFMFDLVAKRFSFVHQRPEFKYFGVD